MAESGDQVLPILNPVTEYEKIKRVGEGTYGVVCEYVSQQSLYAKGHVSTLRCITQTKQETESLGSMLPSKSFEWIEKEMVHPRFATQLAHRWSERI